MQKIRLVLFLFLISTAYSKAQSCSSPLIVTTDGNYRGQDSFSVSQQWHLFNADHDNYKIKLYVKNYTPTNFEAMVYTNNCVTPVAASQTISNVGDTITIYVEGLTISNDYLLKLQNDSSALAYRVYDVEIERWMAYTQAALGCGSSTCATQPSTCELVCNGNFECLTTTVNGLNQLYKAANWTSGNTSGTPDLYTSSATNTIAGTPCNALGQQTPNSGNNYVGIIVTNTDPAQFYEYIETRLASPMVAGKTYVISMYVSKADRSYKQIKNLAIYLTTGQVTQNSTAIFTIAPTATVNNTNLLNDYNNWQYIGFCYTPTVSGQQYLSIGPGSIQTPNVTNGPVATCTGTVPQVNYNVMGYLYIDDVSVQEIKVQSAGTQTVCPSQWAALAAPIPTCNNWAGFVYANWTPSANINPLGYTNPSVNISSNQNFTVDLSFTGSNGQVCSVTGQQSVNVLPNTLTITASTNTFCPGQGNVNLSVSGGTGTYTWQSGNYVTSGISVSPSSATTYSVSGLNSYGCTNTQTIIIYAPLPSNYTFAATTSTAILCTNFGQSATLTASSNDPNTVYTWNPGNLSGAVQVVTPGANTTYTAYGIFGGCVYTKTIAILSNSACCTSTITAYTGSVFPTGNTFLTGPTVFNNDVTVPNGASVTFSGTALFAPNVKVIVANGGFFHPSEAHLYSCGDMWQGIVVQDGGKVRTSKSTLIEDAITAIDITGHTTSTLTVPSYILDVDFTVFNKNRIAINIDGYQRSATDYPVIIKNSVFTSRNFTFTPSAWPTASVTGIELRSPINATTGLLAPYTMQNAAIAYLKAPYTAYTGSVGVMVSNSGVTSGFTFYTPEIGVAGTSSYVNVFDGLMYGINAYNSNVSSVNNVFQNTQRLQFCNPRCVFDGGSAIKAVVFGALNTKLNMSATGTNSTSPSLGNRFWDCHYGVEASNVYGIDCNYATFRSTQATTLTSGINPGYMGIQNSTNRFEFNINNCNFNNVNTGINIPISSGSYTFSGSSYSGIYAGNMYILNNFFGPQTSTGTAITNQYMKQAVYISGTTPSGWLNNASLGTAIQTNTINRVFNGIYMNTYTVGATIKDNKIDLADDGVFSSAQRGITVNNSNNVNVQTNTLSATNITNTAITLIYSGANTNHGVACNKTTNAYKAFEFNSPHMGTNAWKGNIMRTHNYGFVLTNSCVIGTQGSNGNPSDNQWNGTWTGGNNCTLIDGTSDATNSKLWVRTSGGVYWPTNPGYPIGFISQSYGITTNTPQTSTGVYTCPGAGGGGGGGRFAAPNNHAEHTDDYSALGMRLTTGASEISDMDYIYLTAKYRYLMSNDSVRNSDQANIDFCNNLSGTSIQTFAQADDAIAAGNSNSAYAFSSMVTATNNVEANSQRKRRDILHMEYRI
jgi:hypothetical protein